MKADSSSVSSPFASTQDRRILRELAGRVRDIAHEPVMETRRAMWRRHNALRGDRPMVLCFPEGAWSEILTDADLKCSDPANRAIERVLRESIFWRDHINDDNTVEPFFDIGWTVRISGFGVNIPYHHGDDRGSYVWDPPLADIERDFSKLQPRTCAVDRSATQREAERVHDLIGDLLTVRIRSFPWWSVGMTWDAAKLVGLENLMIAMYDQPEALHRLMAFLRDDMLAVMQWWEREGLLVANTGPNDYTGSGGVGAIDGVSSPEATAGSAPARLRDRWGFAESQETVGVGPEMFEQFILPYQVPLLEQFGINCYGCCEPLEQRIDAILRDVPRLRRISVAPMADQEAMAEKLGGRYIFSRKPNPAHVCVDFNEPAIREDLRRTLRCAGSGTVELIMKDTHTVQHDRTRLGRWVEIAREEIEQSGR